MSSDKETDIKGQSGSLTGVLIESRGLGSGASFSGQETNHLWLNDQGKDFITLSGISGADHSGDSRAVALLDYDRDGYGDFVMVNANAPTLQLYRNKMGDMLAEAQRSIPVYLQFVGGNKTAQPNQAWGARDGIGAKVWVEVGGMKYLREYRNGEGLGAQNSAVLALGLGDARKADRLTVLWPNGKQQVIENVAAGALVTAFENKADSPDGSGFKVGPRTPVDRIKPIKEGGGGKQPLAHSAELEKLMDGKTKAPIRMVMAWFVDCSACKKSYPTLNSVRAAFAEDQLAIFGFNNASGDSASEMGAAVQKFGVRFANLEARKSSDIEAWKTLVDKLLKPTKTSSGGTAKASEATPVTLFLDAHGNVLHAMYSFPSVSETVKIMHDLEGQH